MATYLGEIKMFGGNFAPAGWMFCSGQLLSIGANSDLFNLIGTTYGGDGQNTFALPDLRGRLPIHQGQGQSNYVLAETGGVESVTISPNQMPQHTHTPLASNTGAGDNPANVFWANSTTGKPYSAAPPTVQMNPGTITPVGGSQPHNNMIPFLCVSYIICMAGVFPHQ